MGYTDQTAQIQWMTKSCANDSPSSGLPAPAQRLALAADEWAKACTMRQAYWLYAVNDCAAPAPRLIRVQGPIGSLLAKAKGSVLISEKEIASAAIQ